MANTYSTSLGSALLLNREEVGMEGDGRSPFKPSAERGGLAGQLSTKLSPDAAVSV